MNRHGISQNPTEEESRLLRKLWAGDNARARANRAQRVAETLADENARLRAENKRLRAQVPAQTPRPLPDWPDIDHNRADGGHYE